MKIDTFRDETNVTMKLSGFLDFESTTPLCKELKKITPEADTKQVVFDFSGLNFVGSSGVTIFLQVMRDFNAKLSRAPSYINVKSEFKRLIAALDATKDFHFKSLDGAPEAAAPLTTDAESDYLMPETGALSEQNIIKLE